jgi:hypothetical protein
MAKIAKEAKWKRDSIMNSLTPKGPWVPYVEFSDFGQAAVNAFYF